MGFRLLLAALRDTIRRTLYDLYSAYFLPEVMVKSWKRVTGTHRFNNDNNNPLFKHDRFQSSKLVGWCTNQINLMQISEERGKPEYPGKNGITRGKTGVP